MDSMRGLTWDGERLVFREDLPIPQPGEDEALVRVLVAGICGTDLEIVRGYAGFSGVLGHEFVGVVESGPSRWEGKRVVGEINLGCGRCGSCETGNRNHCHDRRVLGIRGHDGAFAEYLALPVENLHAVPEELASEVAVFTEPVAAAWRVVEQLNGELGRTGAGSRALVVGDGRLGLLVAQALEHTNRAVDLWGRHPERKTALSGASSLRWVDEESLAEEYDVVVECTGNAAGLSQALGCVGAGGMLVLKSTYAGRVELDASNLVVDEVRILGSRCGPLKGALEALARGWVDVGGMMQARHPLAEGVAAFAQAAKPGVLKVLIDVALGGR